MKDKNEGGWANPNDFSAVFRCTSTQFAKAFMEKGSIKFNTPSSWIQYSIDKGEGRGDRLEGTIALCHFADIAKIIELNQEYKDYTTLMKMSYNKKIYFKNSKSLSLPCYCLYIMKHSLFECPNKEGEHRVSADIPGSYFRDFMDDLSPQDVEKLSDAEKPALIIISDFNEFRKRLMKKLLDIGLDENEIIISSVRYLDFGKYGLEGWWSFGQIPPKELLIKNKRFENQSEARIIINTDKEVVKKILYSEPIEIGAMHDIAKMYSGYLYEGLNVEMTCKIERLKETD